jgi:hypothetical protein
MSITYWTHRKTRLRSVHDDANNRIKAQVTRAVRQGALSSCKPAEKRLTIPLPEREADLPADIGVRHERTDPVIVRGKVGA